jgi:hypothetical protein
MTTLPLPEVTGIDQYVTIVTLTHPASTPCAWPGYWAGVLVGRFATKAGKVIGSRPEKIRGLFKTLRVVERFIDTHHHVGTV